MNETWGVDGYDTFEDYTDNPFYPIKRGLASEKEAREIAKEHLAKLERTQPSRQSGGQQNILEGKYGIQDQVYIVKPNSERIRVFA